MRKIGCFLFTLVSGVLSFYAGANMICKKMTQGYKKIEKSEKRLLGYYDILVKWMDIIHKNKSLEQYFLQEGIRKIAIYGMGELGVQLLLELKDSSIEVKYAIDQNTENIIEGIKVYKPEDTLDKVDAVIVTPIFAFDAIKEIMENKTSCRILSLEDVVYGIN